MGVIYHAHDPMLERDVALKVMAAADRGRSGPEGPLRARGARGRPDRPPERAHRVRPGVPPRRLALHRDGAAQGQGPAQDAPARPAAAARAQDRRDPAGARGAGPGPSGRHRPPRHQAREHLPQRGRDGEDHGLRRRPLHHGEHHRHGLDHGHRRLHVARAGAGGEGGRPQRPLEHGLHALRAARRPAAVQRRHPDDGLLQDHARRCPTCWSCPKGAVYDRLRAVVAHGLAKDPDQRYPTAADFAVRPPRVPDRGLEPGRPRRPARAAGRCRTSRATMDLGAVAASAVANKAAGAAAAPAEAPRLRRRLPPAAAPPAAPAARAPAIRCPSSG